MGTGQKSAAAPVVSANTVSYVHSRLLRWYDSEKRDLPWRGSTDAYAIWVSEIMLQQTRVAAVIERYAEFLRRFPTVNELACATVDEVLSAWSGLGYYQRARALHAGAREIVHKLGGVLPKTATEWEKLPGIGRYTAAAIASIAFGQPCAVVDGNVERVVARLAGNASLTSNQLWDMAQVLLSPKRPGDFNQAMMELGATVCLPRAPLCLTCPLKALCATRGELPGGTAPRRSKRELTHALCQRGDSILLVQRNEHERIMPGMWELPTAELNGAKPLLRVKHSITSTDYAVTIIRARTVPDSGSTWVPVTDLRQLPLTGLARKVLRRLGII
jgi:A/G-specific adenine glycosylase